MSAGSSLSAGSWRDAAGARRGGRGRGEREEEDDLQALLGARRRRNEEDAEMRERVAEDVETRMDNGVRIDPRLRGRRTRSSEAARGNREATAATRRTEDKHKACNL